MCGSGFEDVVSSAYAVLKPQMQSHIPLHKPAFEEREDIFQEMNFRSASLISSPIRIPRNSKGVGCKTASGNGPRRTTNHARLTKAKNVPAGVSERQALSKLMRCCRSREPIIKYGSRLASMSRFDNGSRLAGIEHRADVFPVSCWERSAYLLKRLLSCVGILKLLEGFSCF
jgi:hypothetical protein